jgi:hypothetical protein
LGSVLLFFRYYRDGGRGQRKGWIERDNDSSRLDPYIYRESPAGCAPERCSSENSFDDFGSALCYSLKQIGGTLPREEDFFWGELSGAEELVSLRYLRIDPILTRPFRGGAGRSGAPHEVRLVRLPHGKFELQLGPCGSVECTRVLHFSTFSEALNDLLHLSGGTISQLTLDECKYLTRQEMELLR